MTLGSSINLSRARYTGSPSYSCLAINSFSAKLRMMIVSQASRQLLKEPFGFFVTFVKVDWVKS